MANVCSNVDRNVSFGRNVGLPVWLPPQYIGTVRPQGGEPAGWREGIYIFVLGGRVFAP